MSQGFQAHTGRMAPLNQANVDTDQIIPKQFLKGVTRTGYGVNLFFDWRYMDGDPSRPNPHFELNKPHRQGATVLLARENFGCGSSREHAPWALADFGFRVIIARSFADIFYGNCLNNQLLPIALNQEQMDHLFVIAEQEPESEVSIDLPSQTVRIKQYEFVFDINAHDKYNLSKGLDAIGQTLEVADDITAFEAKRPAYLS